MITGATGGIGLAVARTLAREGTNLVLTGRNAARGEEAIRAVREVNGDIAVDFIQSDFASLDQVASLAQTFLRSDRPLHVLVNNAGIVNTSRRLTVDGHEEMFAVNFLAHFLLTRLLLDRLKDSAPARIVHVSSNAHAFCRGIRFDDLGHAHGFSTFPVYGHSKLANILFSNELARRLRGSRVSSNAVHPGAVATGLGTNNWGIAGRLIPALIRPFMKRPDEGAATVVHVAGSPELEGVTGRYFQDSREVAPRPWARDRDTEGRLWGVSEKLLLTWLQP
jgi:NAD(P)-dependent dehydrogenase (short-subunit alcohol dehydrogenase family)